MVHAFPPQDLPGGGIKSETSVEVEDFSQDLTVKLNIFHKTFDEEEVSAPVSELHDRRRFDCVVGRRHSFLGEVVHAEETG